MELPILTIVVPCYNEEEVFPVTYVTLKAKLEKFIHEKLIHPNSRLMFIDDGSQDSTWDQIVSAYEQDEQVVGIKLSRNFGHQRALLAGLQEAVAFSDCVISIDADLQDDVNVMKEFIIQYLQGYDIVYGVRNSRKTDTFFKRTTAIGFYRLMEKMGIPLVFNHADYRLLSKRAIMTLLEFQEANLFLRGIVPLVGFKATNVYYDRKERVAGETKYPLRKMISFALDGITSFSVKPIRLISLIGFLAACLSLIAAIVALIEKIMSEPVSGWTSLIISIWFIGGLMLMSIGLIGEYIGKIYEEVKGRPRFIVEECLTRVRLRNESIPQKVME